AKHAFIHRSTQSRSVHAANRVEAIPSRLTQSPYPGRIKLLLTQRVVTRRTRRDRQEGKHRFQPAGHARILQRLDMPPKAAPSKDMSITQTVNPGIHQPDHTLRTRRFSLPLVLRRVKLTPQFLRVAIRQRAVPEFGGHFTRSTRDAASVHEPERRLNPH